MGQAYSSICGSCEIRDACGDETELGRILRYKDFEVRAVVTEGELQAELTPEAYLAVVACRAAQEQETCAFYMDD